MKYWRVKVIDVDTEEVLGYLNKRGSWTFSLCKDPSHKGCLRKALTHIKDWPHRVGKDKHLFQNLFPKSHWVRFFFEQIEIVQQVVYASNAGLYIKKKNK